MSELNNVTTNMEDFKELQQRLNHESIKFQFRTKLVGGLNEDDVTEYIEKIEAKLRGLEQEHNLKLNEIFSLREILNREIQDKKNLQENLDNAQTLNEENISEISKMQNLLRQMSEEKEHLLKQLSDSNLKIENLNCYGEEFEQNYNLLKSKLNVLENDNALIPEFKNQIIQMTENQETLENQLSESNLKFEKMMSYAVKFEEENATMKSKIAEFEQANADISQLKQKIVQMTNAQEELEKQLLESRTEIEQINKYDDWLKENNNVLKTRIGELEQELESIKIQYYEVNYSYEELIKQIESEKYAKEKFDADSEFYIQKISTLENTIAKNMAEIEELQSIRKNAEQELNSEKAKLSSYKLNGFKDELSHIYKQIETLSNDLEQHIKINDDLKQQIEAEQLRASKAENNVDSLSKLVSALKDELTNEQNLIEIQFKQILEKRNKFNTDINDCLISLHQN